MMHFLSLKHHPTQKPAMEFISAILLILLILIIHRILSPKTGRKKTPPEAGGSRLFTGHLHLMYGGSSSSLPHKNLGLLADKYGPVFTIRLGRHRALVVSSKELAQELFTTCDGVVSSRPKLRANKHLGYSFAMFGFAPYGAYWRELRKLISSELLSPRRIELQREVFASEMWEFVRELYKVWERDGSGRVRVEMKEWFGELDLNVLLRMVVGKRLGYGGGGEGAAETRRWREVMRDFFYLAGVFVPADAFPGIGWMDLGGYERRMKETAAELERIVGGWLVEHREREYSGEDRPQDFMDVMLATVRAVDFQGKYDDDTIIKATCQSLIVAGSDTITVMVVWALSLLLNNRPVLLKAQQELDQIVGRERHVNESDISKLVYLQAFVKETLRLYPAGPLGSAREFTQDCHVAGYHVPKGTWLILNLWKMHRDPQVWRDPLECMPERFLDEHRSLDAKGHHFEFIPFGAGRRICPGVNFGLHVLHLVLANLLHSFELSTVSDEAVDMTESAGLTNIKATPLDVLIAPRLPSSFYNIEQ